MMYGLRWKETDRNDQIVTKEKDFRTEQERAKFIAKLKEKGNFIEVVAYSDPEQAEAPAPALQQRPRRRPLAVRRGRGGLSTGGSGAEGDRLHGVCFCGDLCPERKGSGTGSQRQAV